DRPPAASPLLPYTTLFRSEGDAAAVDGAGGRHQGHLADVAGALVGVQHLAQQGLVLLGAILHALAVPEGDMEAPDGLPAVAVGRSEEHTSELQSRFDLVCR